MTSDRPDDVYSLVADVGGTNTRVALAIGAALQPDTIRRFSNAQFPSLEALLGAYLEAEGGVDCASACVAVAGPVREGRGTLTNLAWTIDEALLARTTGAETAAVLNDLQAQGHALGHIAPENVRTVLEGAPAEDSATRLVIGVGTGFNVAPVYVIDDTRLVVPAEAGHVTLPVRTAEDLRLGSYVESAQGFASVEDVLSGRGLSQVYGWLGEEEGDPRKADAATIVEACRAGSDDRARRAVATFIRFLAAVAGDQALMHLPFGGIYLAGGVARSITPYLAMHGFAEAFRDKGRFSRFVADFPVYVIEDDYAALAGAAAHLARITRVSAGRRAVTQ